MIRKVAGDLYQIGESVVGDNGWHEAVRIYVLLNDGCPLLFDAGSHIHRGQIMNDLKELLGDTVPGFVFLTHTELPHTGNLSAILAEWPEINLVVSSAILPHVELPWWLTDKQIQYGYAGTVGTYGNREISFSDGIIKDQPGTHWMFDEETGALFTADAFGYLYPQPADQKFDDELDEGILVDWFKRYHESAFRFLPMVDGKKVNADIAKVFAKRKVDVIAPTHGNAIRGNLNLHVERFNQAILEVCG
jgi:flavorubredoxin